MPDSSQPRSFIYSRTFATVSCLLLAFGVVYGFVWWQTASKQAETLELAERLLEENRTQQVRDTLSRVLWFQPDQPNALFLQGASLYIEQEYDEAISYLARVSVDSSAYGAASLTLAKAFLDSNRPERAEQVLLSHLHVIPQSDPARQFLTELYMQQLRKRDAVAVLEDRARLFPNDLSVFRGLLLLDSQRVTPNSRLPALEETNSTHPDQPSVILAMAKSHLLLGRIEQARTGFALSLKLRPQHLATQFEVASFHLDAGEIQQATNIVERLTGTQAELDDRYWMLRSSILELTGEPEEALEAANRAIEIRPREKEYFLRLAGLLRQQDRLSDASQAAVKAEEMGRASHELFLLVEENDIEQPTASMCEALVSIYETLNLPGRASAWKEIGVYAKEAEQ